MKGNEYIVWVRKLMNILHVVLDWENTGGKLRHRLGKEGICSG